MPDSRLILWLCRCIGPATVTELRAWLRRLGSPMGEGRVFRILASQMRRELVECVSIGPDPGGRTCEYDVTRRGREVCPAVMEGPTEPEPGMAHRTRDVWKERHGGC
jgi:hypothetical protein